MTFVPKSRPPSGIIALPPVLVEGRRGTLVSFGLGTGAAWAWLSGRRSLATWLGLGLVAWLWWSHRERGEE